MMLRVIFDYYRDPIVNMAIDEAIYRYRTNVDFDTLRLYMWRPSGVSIGRSQNVYDTIDLNCISRLGFIPVVRPTGGGALLHMEGGEITYSIILGGENSIIKLDIPTSAVEIAKGVYNSLVELGVDAGISGEYVSSNLPLCYFRRGSSDILINGKKISGSAQVRNRDAILQHGTLLLNLDYDLWACVIKGVDKNLLKERVTSLKDLGIKYSLKNIYRSMLNGFLNVLNDDYFFGTLLPEEIEIVDELINRKYKPWLSSIGFKSI